MELEYEEFLQGTPGKVAYRVNPDGDILEEVGSLDPVQGSTLWLTLDVSTQEVVEGVLVEALDLANTLKEEDTDRVLPPAERAAAVVMEIDTGAILAMASHPGFEPQAFVGGIDVATFEELSSRQAFNNLVIQGLKPPASTFKVGYLRDGHGGRRIPPGCFIARGIHRVLTAAGCRLRGCITAGMAELDLSGVGRPPEPP